MGKKTIILLSIAALVLLGGIITALVMLYGGNGGSREPRASRAEVADMLQAVPEDASLVMCTSSIGRLSELLLDSTKVYDAVLCDARSKAFLEFAEALPQTCRPARDERCVVSLHYGGNLVPLMVLDAAHIRETEELDAAASAYSLEAECVSLGSRRYYLVSTSESVLSSAVRHLAEGGSILDDKSFAECLAGLSGKDLILWSGVHSGKLLGTYCQRPYQKYSSAIRTAAAWCGAGIVSNSSRHALLSGLWSLDGSGSGSLLSLLESNRRSAVQAGKVLPVGTVSAVDIPLADVKAYHRRYLKYLDANNRLSAYKSASAELRRSVGKSPEEWLDMLSPKELVNARWRNAEGEMVSANFLRSSKLRRFDTSAPYKYSSYASLCFGELFALEDESVCARMGSWLVSGSAPAVEDALACFKEGDNIASLYPDTQCGALLYADLGICAVDEIFRQPLAGAVKRSLLGAATQTAAVTVDGSVLSLAVDRSTGSVRRSGAAPGAQVYSIDVPEGPWEVTNFATGKKNKLYQNSHLSICLQDENGKDVWGVPFKDRICGMVEEIDYYGNGKLQFLFAAGSKLYLMDRLSRTVKDFPADLGREVLLGPSVYDFTGAHGYTVMVLHKDNTLAMYNLHGKSPAEWQDIAPEEMIVGLPELARTKAGRFWLVPTVSGRLVYPFYGGEVVKDKKILNLIKK